MTEFQLKVDALQRKTAWIQALTTAVLLTSAIINIIVAWRAQ